MNIHDEFIRKANREIDKLTADIEKKKKRISELRSEIKTHEAERTRDNEFSNNLIKLMSDNGVTSDEDRKAIFSKFEEFMLDMEIKKAENQQMEETMVSSENSENSTYHYKPTGN